MTASRRDPLSNISSPRLCRRALILSASLAGAMLTACHAGLPAEPPGADPADPAAASAPYQIQPNPYETSAFAGEQAPRADEHAGHGNMNHGSKAQEHVGHGAPAPAAPTEPEHAGHGATEKKSAADSDAMPPNMHKQPEPPR